MSQQISLSNRDTTVSCYHCGTICNDLTIRQEEKYFCCEGCKLVYELLDQNGLCKYYDLNEHPGLAQKFSMWREKFAFLELPEIQQQLLRFSDGKQSHVHLFLPQMHCSSCLWLLEQIHRMDPGIVYSRVQFADKKIHLVFDEAKTSLRKIVELLTTLGYEPQLDLKTNAETGFSGNSKSRIIKIGVAGFAFANIMMLSLPEYFSGGELEETQIGKVFSLLIVMLSLPVFFYCAAEFFKGAWHGLKSRYLNIDLPIALAVVLTFGRSLFEIQSGLGNGYLDSMSGIVFFMLVGRFVQDRSNRSLSFDRNYRSFFPIAVLTERENQVIPVPIEKLRVNDIIHIHNQEIVPADGILLQGTAALDYSFVTGESNHVTVKHNEKIFAGARQTGGQISLRVQKPVEQSYLTSLWNRHFENKQPAQLKKEIDRLGMNFTFIVLLLAGLAAIYWYQQGRNDLMWNAMTTILIVACPCALLLAANYTNGQVMNILAENKMYIRHADVLEHLQHIDHVVFDKTGTLTESSRQRIQFVGIHLLPEQARRFYSLARQSNHPLSMAIFQYGNLEHTLEVEHFKQWEGKGIEAWLEEHHLKMGSATFIGVDEPKVEGGTCIHLREDGKYLGYFLISHQYRQHLEEVFEKTRQHYEVSVLSGDNDAEKKYMNALVKKEDHVKFHCSPEDKLQYICQLQRAGEKTLMVGDGLNDAGALKQSHVGIAVTENKNNFTPGCDAILDGSSFHLFPKLIQFVKDGRKIILIVFGYSFLYNIIGSFFALRGELSPVIAAVLMPASSLSIIGLTYFFTRIAARKLRLNG